MEHSLGLWRKIFGLRFQWVFGGVKLRLLQGLRVGGKAFFNPIGEVGRLIGSHPIWRDCNRGLALGRSIFHWVMQPSAASPYAFFLPTTDKISRTFN